MNNAEVQTHIQRLIDETTPAQPDAMLRASVRGLLDEIQTQRDLVEVFKQEMDHYASKYRLEKAMREQAEAEIKKLQEREQHLMRLLGRRGER